MTSIKLVVTGANAQAEVTGVLTSGMVGIPIAIEYDDTWQGLAKNLVCKCSHEYGRYKDSVRTIANIGDSAIVAHEVMQPDMYLYLGIEGYSPDGTLIVPTTWAKCGRIFPGACTEADPSADPTLPVWARLDNEITRLKQSAVSSNQVMAAIETYLKDHTGDVLDQARINALHGMFQVCAYDGSKDVSGAYAAFLTAFGITDTEDDSGSDSGETEVTLVSISAAYSGGDAAAGTAVTDLTGIVVTAHYSDGTSEAVTGYTLSGTIGEGENTVTVSYGGKTTNFTVTGVVDSGGGSGAVVAMGEWGACGDFQYNGGAIYADDGSGGETISFGSGVSKAILSDKTFDEDTAVTITLSWTGSFYDSFYAGSTNAEEVNKKIVMYYGIPAGTKANVSNGSTTIEYTVRAGYRLAVMAFNNSPGNISVVEV